MKKIISLLMLLSLSIEVFAAVPQKDELDFGSQITIAQNLKLPMSARWQALQKAAEVANYYQIAEIKKFATSKDWYMRNATLIALEKININHAVGEAQVLLKDKALVVRSAAVDILAKRYNRENRNFLAEELAKPYNFAGHQSLWIRPKIFNIIAAKASGDDRNFFAKYLFDKDEKIVKSAVATLERITDIHFDTKNKVSDWRSYVKKSGWL